MGEKMMGEEEWGWAEVVSTEEEEEEGEVEFV